VPPTKYLNVRCALRIGFYTLGCVILNVRNRSKNSSAFLVLVIISLIVLPAFSTTKATASLSQPIPIAEPTPLIPPSTTAPAENYSVPPLSSLILKVEAPYGSAIGGLILIKGGSGNDINFRVINSQGKTILDYGRISSEKSFQFYADRTGNFTIIFDNEFSFFSAKEVDVFSYSYPNSLFEFGGYSVNFWVILFVALAFVVVLMAFVVWLIIRKRKERNVEASKHLGA
jgi:hypothetical protein